MADAAAQTAAIARLDAVIGQTGAATELAAFDAEEAAAMRRWSLEAPDELPPAPRSEQRAELVASVRADEERAAAARAAKASAEAELLRLNGSLAPLRAQMRLCALSALRQQAEPIVDRAEEGLNQLERDIVDLGGLLELLDGEAALVHGTPAAAVIREDLVGLQGRLLFAAGWLPQMRHALPKAAERWRAIVEDLIKENADAE